MSEHKPTDKEELIDIYNNLLPPLKKQIINIAKIIENTKNALLDECNTENKELHKLKSDKK